MSKPKLGYIPRMPESDREVLMFFHERLVHVHGECELTDYMHRLRSIIAKTPPRRYTPSGYGFNNMEELVDHMDKKLRKKKK